MLTGRGVHENWDLRWAKKGTNTISTVYTIFPSSRKATDQLWHSTTFSACHTKCLITWSFGEKETIKLLHHQKANNNLFEDRLLEKTLAGKQIFLRQKTA